MRRFAKLAKLAKLGATAFLTVLLLLASGYVLYAQTPNDSVFDIIARDLSLRVGKTIDFKARLDGNYSFEEVRVTDGALGCPAAGVKAPNITRAWKIVVTLTNLGTYEYRATGDASIVFFCTGTGVGATLTTPVPTTPTPVVPVVPVVPAAPVAVQGTVFAFIGNDSNLYVSALSTNAAPTPLTNDAQRSFQQGVVVAYSNPIWSPDGTRLAFVRRSAQGPATLMVAASGQAPIQVASGLDLAFMPSWSPDGKEVAYAIGTQQPTTDANSIVYQVQAVAATGGQPRVAGTLSFGVGCGGGGFGPSTIAYFDEAGYGGNNQPIYWTTSGFVHSTNCTGADGLALTRFDGQRAWKLDRFGRAALSPDRKQLVAISFMPPSGQGLQAISVNVIDIASGQARPVATPGLQPDQVGWSSDGTQVLFSTRRASTTVAANPALSKVGEQVFMAWPVTAQNYTVTLYVIPAAGGTPTPLFSQEGDSVGRIVSSPTVALTTFSFIESEAAMVNKLNAGGSVADVLAVSPKTYIVVTAQAANTQGYPYLFSRPGGQPTFSRATQFIAVAGTPTMPVVNPGTLQIGSVAVVPPGGNVNIRQNPSTSAAVMGIIRPGDTVTIIGGPQNNEGLIWWQVRRNADNVVGWVAQYDKAGVPNLSPMN